MDFTALKTAGKIAGIGTGIGGAIGVVDQMWDVERGIDSNTPEAYKNSAIRYMKYGAAAGLGLYGLGHTSNKKIYATLLGIGGGLGVAKGIQNQVNASKKYNDTYADPYSLTQSGARFGAVGLLNGAGAYGGYEVARRIAKGVM